MTGRTGVESLPGRRYCSGQAGFSIIEALVAALLMTLVGGAIFAGVMVILRSDADQQARSVASVASRNYGDALASAPYTECGGSDAYSAESIGLPAQTDATITVTAVGYWTGAALPATAQPTPAQWDAAFSTACTTDKGLQRITYKVTAVIAGTTFDRTTSMLKRFNGALPEPEPDPPPGGHTCIVSDTAQVDSTWVNETAGRQNTNYSTGSDSAEMNILYLAGTRRFSYLRFKVQPGTPCDNGGTLPAGANIVAAQVRLYTFNIGGLPACGANSCWHVMERVRGNWNQATLTWGNQPCPTTYAKSCQSGDAASTILFEHGTGALNWGARFQRVEGAQLLADVKNFYANPSTNYGWVIKEACAETYGKACGSATPGFQMRSSRASDVSQRPTLTLFY